MGLKGQEEEADLDFHFARPFPYVVIICYLMKLLCILVKLSCVNMISFVRLRNLIEIEKNIFFASVTISGFFSIRWRSVSP